MSGRWRSVRYKSPANGKVCGLQSLIGYSASDGQQIRQPARESNKLLALVASKVRHGATLICINEERSHEIGSCASYARRQTARLGDNNKEHAAIPRRRPRSGNAVLPLAVCEPVYI